MKVIGVSDICEETGLSKKEVIALLNHPEVQGVMPRDKNQKYRVVADIFYRWLKERTW